MGKITEILTKRRREVLAEIEAAVGPLQAELREIDAALEAIGGSPNRGMKPQIAARHRTRRRLSIADRTIQVLEVHPKGLKTADIAAELNKGYENIITNRNVSWYLSQLKRDGRVILERELWRITCEIDETPDSAESGATDHNGGGNGTLS